MNALKNETSPYLLQHADNPVDWYPWGDEALELARSQDKPILLSIGYSACHWCHVMAHESFEDEQTATLMNRLFVNIKIDREERPDIDKIYQAAHQLMQRRPGGWPLTVFLDPGDHRPFFAGTYFPKEARYGMPAFTELLNKANEHFQTNRDAVSEYGQSIVAALQHINTAQPADGDLLSGGSLPAVREALEQTFDNQNGGFGDAPKFPHPTNLERLMRHWRNAALGGRDDGPDKQAMFICALTLSRMAEGGIFDQVGGGFCRYSVDAEWSIPHFEKMLYDNGQLLALYAQFWQISGDETYRRVALDTAGWVLREMRAPEGAFYAALDADSEGVEGRFYIWNPDEVRGILTGDEYTVFAPRFGLDKPANFEGDWHLRVSQTIATIAANTGQNPSTVQRLIDAARLRLLNVRDTRIRPGRDDKILTSWNALMIRGLAIAAHALQDEAMASAAAQALDFIRHNMVVDGRLCATYKDSQARLNAYLDDYAFLLDATIELLQVRWNSEHLEFAVWLADRLLADFTDSEHGGFFFTAADHEQLIHRSKPMSDEALPSGNGIAALALNRLGHLLGETKYLEAAVATIKATGGALEEFPHAHTSLITALDEIIAPAEIVILRGESEEISRWSLAIGAVYTPKRLVFAIPDDVADLPAALSARMPADQPIAYICRGTTCSQPLTSLEAITAELDE
jgi:uncharacterized protein YyaL (SSP411 family)